MLDVDTAGAGAGKIAHKLFIMEEEFGKDCAQES